MSSARVQLQGMMGKSAETLVSADRLKGSSLNIWMKWQTP